MEKGRSAGSYMLYLVREAFYRMKTELIGWRGLAFLAIGAYMVIDTFVAVEEMEQLMFQGMGALWMVLLFPPRMGKLLYLLPFSKKERVRYLGTYSVGYLLFHVMVFVVIGVISCLLSGYSFVAWMGQFVFCTFPLMLLYSGVVVDSMSAAIRQPYSSMGWWWFTSNAWKQNADRVDCVRQDCGGKVLEKTPISEEEKEKAKKQKRFTVYLVLCAIVPAVHGCGSYMYSTLCKQWPWLLYVITILAYVSAIIGLLLYWNRISEEMNKTGSTGKEAGVCNS